MIFWKRFGEVSGLAPEEAQQQVDTELQNIEAGFGNVAAELDRLNGIIVALEERIRILEAAA